MLYRKVSELNIYAYINIWMYNMNFWLLITKTDFNNSEHSIKSHNDPMWSILATHKVSLKISVLNPGPVSRNRFLFHDARASSIVHILRPVLLDLNATSALVTVRYIDTVIIVGHKHTNKNTGDADFK